MPEQSTIFKIEKGVPLPPEGQRTKYPFAEMEVGDSFVIPGKMQHSAIQTTLRYQQTRYGRTYRAARIEGGMRIWRTA